MNLTNTRLIELGWTETSFEGHTFLVNGDRVLVNIAGVWALGRYIFNEPYIPLSNPIYVNSEEQLNRLLQ
ncbi:hypothetical protein [Cellulophaga sp. HaHa_2_1]|uniref:hypothetical protein n=1 Tax=Cellulophaga sp. HaHa_2_1 TaxID=2749994 RepID=UPI001C4EE7EB|nr:hypothetical protein [Cellulophaga sp. HaHa_2_1]QXP52873.1 hypothetical protein H0I24_02815 [Cellulophaga sp. HaHa_2_1]